MILAFDGSFDISFLMIYSNTTFHMIYEQRSQLLIWLYLLGPSILWLASAMRHEQKPVWFPLQFSRFIVHHNENPFYRVYLVTVDDCGFYTTYSWLNSSAVCDAPGGTVTLIWPVHFILCSIVRWQLYAVQCQCSGWALVVAVMLVITITLYTADRISVKDILKRVKVQKEVVRCIAYILQCFSFSCSTMHYA